MIRVLFIHTRDLSKTDYDVSVYWIFINIIPEFVLYLHIFYLTTDKPFIRYTSDKKLCVCVHVYINHRQTNVSI